MHGKGTRFFASGFRYEGEFFEDFLHGNGTVTSPSGVVWSGRFNKESPMSLSEETMKRKIASGIPLPPNSHTHSYSFEGDRIIFSDGFHSEDISPETIERGALLGRDPAVVGLNPPLDEES